MQAHPQALTLTRIWIGWCRVLLQQVLPCMAEAVVPLVMVADSRVSMALLTPL